MVDRSSRREPTPYPTPETPEGFGMAAFVFGHWKVCLADSVNFR